MVQNFRVLEDKEFLLENCILSSDHYTIQMCFVSSIYVAPFPIAKFPIIEMTIFSIIAFICYYYFFNITIYSIVGSSSLIALIFYLYKYLTQPKLSGIIITLNSGEKFGIASKNVQFLNDLKYILEDRIDTHYNDLRCLSIYVGTGTENDGNIKVVDISAEKDKE